MAACSGRDTDLKGTKPAFCNGGICRTNGFSSHPVGEGITLNQVMDELGDGIFRGREHCKTG